MSDVTFILIPGINWRISFGLPNTLTINTDFTTPFKMGYQYSQTDAKDTKTCKSGNYITASGAVVGIGYSLLGAANYNYPITPPTTGMDVAQNTDSSPNCLAKYGTAPLPTSSSSSSDDGLSEGEIAGIVIATLFGTAAVCLSAYYLYLYSKKEPLSSSSINRAA